MPTEYRASLRLTSRPHVLGTTVLVVIGIAGCVGTAATTTDPVPRDTPSASVDAGATHAVPTPSPGPTSSPTPSTSPTATATPTPSAPRLDERPATADELPIPDFAAVVFSDAAGLWVVEGTNGPRHIRAEAGLGDPIVAPDRSWIAYSRLVEASDAPAEYGTVHEPEAWVVRFDGTGAKRLFGSHDLPVEDLPERFRGGRWPRSRAWIPGREAVAFTSYGRAREPGGMGDPYELSLADDLWIVDVTSGDVRRVLAYGEGGRFAWSPDGARVAIVRPGSGDEVAGVVAIANGEGSEPRVVLEFGQVGTGSEFQFYPRPYWTPDGSALLVAVPGVGPHEERGYLGEGPTDLYRIPVDGQAERIGAVTMDWLVWGAFQQWRPDWSPWDPMRERILWPQVIPWPTRPPPPPGAYPPPPQEPSPSQRYPGVELRLGAADAGEARTYAALAPVQLTGWSPDGRHFLVLDRHWAYVGGPDEPLRSIGLATEFGEVRWIDGETLVGVVGEGEGRGALVIWSTDGRRRDVARLEGAAALDVAQLLRTGP